MKISIIIPIYNVEKYLEKCLESVINQTYKKIEIILVDDGSTDSSLDICNRYKSKDRRIKVYSKLNGGLSDARNYGLEKATGEYILFLDSDDFIEIETCLKFSNYINKNKDIEIFCGNAIKLYPLKKEKMIRKNNFEKVITGKEYLKIQLSNSTMYMAAWLNVYKREFLINKNLKFKKGILHEDEEFTPRVFLQASKVVGTDIIFYNYLIREGSITTKEDKTKNAEHLFKTCRELDLLYDQLEDIELRKLLKNDLLEKYLNMFQVAKLYRKKYNFMIDINFLNKKAYTNKNKLKIFLFKLDRKIYYLVNKILKAISR